MTTLTWISAVGIALPLFGEGAPVEHAVDILKLQAGFHLAGLILSIAAALYVCILALMLLTTFLAPGITQRGSEQVQAGAFRAFLVGLAADVALILLAVATSRVHVLAVLGIPLLILLVIGGMTVVSQDLGRRAFALSGRSGSRFGRLVAGWGIALPAAAIPHLGWWVIGPVLLTMGMGGFLLALFARAGEPKPVSAASAEPPPGPASSAPPG